MNIKTRWQLHFAVIIAPFSVLLVAGTYWLWQQHMLLIWLEGSAVVSGIWWLVHQRLNRENPNLQLLDISASLAKTSQTELAFKCIETIAAQRRNSNPDLTSSTFYMQTLLEVMQAVAEQYYPQKKDALLEVKLPYLLKVVETLAQELRINVADNIPGSHIFSLRDLFKSRKLATRASELYRLLRIVSAGFDPVSAMIRELRILTSDSLLAYSTAELKSWLIDAYIKKIGYYAIELYSGTMVLDNGVFTKATRQSQLELDQIKQREDLALAEPFRILVLGQTNAGKSSLINALFGAKKAETDVIPTTEGITAYHLQRSDVESAIILDCEGYGSDACQHLFAKAEEEIVRSDLIILAVSATNAARDPDKKMLQAIRNCFSSKAINSLPPIVVALTHIDQLRPLREWLPPYDIMTPCSPKAQAIRQMMETITIELDLSIEQIAPVNLKVGYEYNIEEGLIPTIYQQLEQAKQVRYLRCLKAYHKEDYWRRLWRQSKSAGRFIAKKGLSTFDNAAKNFSDDENHARDNSLKNAA